MIYYTEFDIKKNDKGLPVSFTIKLDHRNALLSMIFFTILPNMKARPELMDEAVKLEEDANFLEQHLLELTVIKEKKSKYTVKFTTRSKDDTAAVQQILSSPIISNAIDVLFKELATDKDHKQSRSLSRTIARTVGNDTKQRTLWDVPLEGIKLELEKQIAESPNGILTKEVMSKKTALLAQTLVKYYGTLPKIEEGTEKGYVTIEDMNQLAEDIGTDSKRLKYFLLYLGGYQYTHVAHFDDAIGFKITKLFDIWLMYDKSRAAKIEIMKDTNTIDETINIIRNERIKCIRIKPTQEFIRDLQGKGLGYFRTSDKFLAACNDMTEMAYKLFNFSASQKPKYSISEEKLYEHLNLKDQVKKQGSPYIRGKIKGAIEELQTKGHFKNYTIDERPDGYKYSWTYTDVFVKYADDKAQEYIDYKDTSIPIQKRRERYQAYLEKERKFTRLKAQQYAQDNIRE